MGMGPSKAVEIMPYPVGGIPCAASVTSMQLKITMEESKKKMQANFEKVLPTLEGTLSPIVAIQFPRSDAKGINDVNMLVCYGSKAQADVNLGKVKAHWEHLKEDLVGEPKREIVEGVVFPIAKFLFDEPFTLIPVGMSFGTYPLKPYVTMDVFKAALTSEGLAMLRNEFGVIWMWAGVTKDADDKPMAIISAVYSCEEACVAVGPKIGKVFEHMGFTGLMDGAPFSRKAGPGFIVKK